MRAQSILCILIPFLFFSCEHFEEKTTQEENPKYQEDYWRHLDYLIGLKNDVAESKWKDFSKVDFFQPAIFYTSEGTYAINPNEHIRSITEHQDLESHNDVEIIKLSESYTDTLNFNFNTSYSGTDTTALYYKENVLFFQSFDLSNKMIGITDLQDWSIMVIHELFHGYQRAIPEFQEYYLQLPIPGGPDEYLAKYHKELDWCRESIHNENELLKSIWIENAELIETLCDYDSLRTLRIERIKSDYDIDIREVEDYEIMIEGHARYFESLCKRYLAKNSAPSSMLNEEDIELISNMFDGYDVAKDKGLYNIYNDRYYYQLGYNISMILEKYLPEYEESIYVKENNFNTYLGKLCVKTALRNRPNSSSYVTRMSFNTISEF